MLSERKWLQITCWHWESEEADVAYPSVRGHCLLWWILLLFVVVSSLNRVQLFATPWTAPLQAPLSRRTQFFPGKNTGVGYHFLLQRIFPTQGSNPCLLHWQAGSSPLRPQGNPNAFNMDNDIGWHECSREQRKYVYSNPSGIFTGIYLHQMKNNPPAMRETWFWSLGWEDPLEKETATHSSILASRIPWTEEPGRLQSTGFQKSWTQLSY